MIKTINKVFNVLYVLGDRNSWLLGDSGYPQEPWLMTPIVNANPGSPESRYTDAHIQTRNAIERCIGLYKSRFLCLSKILRYAPEKVGNIANACAILHNMCVSAEHNVDFNICLPQVDAQGLPIRPVAAYINRDGIAVRQNLVQRYFN